MPEKVPNTKQLDTSIEENICNVSSTSSDKSETPVKNKMESGSGEGGGGGGGGGENTESSDPKTPDTPKYNISNFRLKQVLNNNSARKSAALLGTFPDVSDSDKAIVILERQAFRECDFGSNKTENDKIEKDDLVQTEKPTFFNSDLKVSKEFVNNIYGSYQCQPNAALNGVKVSVVYPATEKHIKKYSICQKYLISETPQLYKSITLPYIESSQFTLDWVYNILEHKEETERIIYEDPDPETGFILLPDLKWDGRNVETLYLLAITHKRNIKSLRDLNATHLPLLRKLKTNVAEAIKKHYGLHETQLRMYFHYQPSFYHLHLHINPIRNDAPGIWCEKSHLLDTVISNLELISDYYERATIPFVLYEDNKLLDLYEAEIVVRNPRDGLKRNIDETEVDGNGKDGAKNNDDAKIKNTDSDDDQPAKKRFKLDNN